MSLEQILRLLQLLILLADTIRKWRDNPEPPGLKSP